MGTVNLPSSGLIYLDASIFVYSVQKHPQFGPPLRQLWSAVKAGAVNTVTSELSLLECLVLPLRLNDVELANAFEQALSGSDVRLAPIDSETLRRAARLRADRSSLRTPDAIHLATAERAGASAFLTNDARLASQSPIPALLVTNLIDINPT